MKIMREEIFGPVVSIAKFKDEEEVIELANDTAYGLAAGIFTKDYERAVRVTSALRAGTTWVNMFNFVNWSMPFGGYKESGIGRECGDAALENYTETKTVYLNMGMSAHLLTLVVYVIKMSKMQCCCGVTINSDSFSGTISAGLEHDLFHDPVSPSMISGLYVHSAFLLWPPWP